MVNIDEFLRDRVARRLQKAQELEERTRAHPLTVHPDPKPGPKIVIPKPERVRQPHAPRKEITLRDDGA